MTATGFNYAFEDADFLLRSLSGSAGNIDSISSFSESPLSNQDVYYSESSGGDNYESLFNDGSEKSANSQNFAPSLSPQENLFDLRDNPALRVDDYPQDNFIGGPNNGRNEQAILGVGLSENVIKQENNSFYSFDDTDDLTNVTSSATGSRPELKKTSASYPDSKISKPRKDRMSHNLIEKKYRTNINDKIIALRDSVPSLRAVTDDSKLDELEGLTPASKLNKASILTKATEYIRHLEQKNGMLMNEIVHLRTILQQQQHSQQSQPVFVAQNSITNPQYNNLPRTQNFSPPPGHQAVPMSFGNKVLVGGMTALVGTQLFNGGDGQDGFDYKGMSALPIAQFFPLVKSPLFGPFVHVVTWCLFFGGVYTIMWPFFRFLLAPRKKGLKTVDNSGTTIFSSVLLELSKYYAVRMGFVNLTIQSKIKKLDELNGDISSWFSSTIMNASQNDGNFLVNWRVLVSLYLRTLSLDSAFLSKYKSPDSIIFQCSRLILQRLIFTKLGRLSRVFGDTKSIDSSVLNLLKDVKNYKSSTDPEKDRIVKSVATLLDLDVGALEDNALFKDILLVLNLEKFNPQNSAISQRFISSFRDSELNLVNFAIFIKTEIVLKQVATDYLGALAKKTEANEEVSNNLEAIISKVDSIIPASCLDLIQTSKTLHYLLDISETSHLNSIFQLVTDEVSRKLDYYGYDQSMSSVGNAFESTNGEAINEGEEVEDEEDEEDEEDGEGEEGQNVEVMAEKDTTEVAATGEDRTPKTVSLDSIKDATVLRISKSVEPTRVFRSDLASKSNLILLTCCLCLHYRVENEWKQVDILLNHLKAQCSSVAVGELNIFAFVALFKLFAELTSAESEISETSKRSLETVSSKLRLLIGNSSSSDNDECSTLANNFIPHLDYQLRGDVSENLVAFGKTLLGYS
ncbi:unnamed protein product [Kuraishia capsulata CBS 1993]|uniref:BHLH domain-containing protein n=1 Tax=Kuraishia capsulata CBS 1993 TaxID=1382522 RepID=W6MIJ4_9ASCO|nr:uncharacterized protein KUCA_T00002265001 [Kuraishia capsulata CBS 1993]CDK26294.1 unnamed protein product [Kuraishia capsulata CBS 1993]